MKRFLTLSTALVAGFFLATGPGVAADAALAEGLALYNSGKFVPAAASFRKVVAANPRNSGAYYYMACCYYRLGQTEDAKALYTSVLQQFPRSAEAGLARQMLSQLSPAQGAAYAADPISTPRGNNTVAAVAPAAASSSEENLPDDNKFYFRRASSGHMETDAFINGRPLKVWFDTGAGAHFGFNQLAPLGILKPARNPDGYTSGWAGAKVPVWVMKLPVRLGNMTRTITCSVEEDMNLQPLVGQDFIKGYTYEIDDKGGCMTMKKQGTGTSNQTFDPLYDVPCTKQGKDDFIPLDVNGKKCQAFIDTGAAFTIIHPSTMRALGIEIPDDAQTGMIQGVGGATAVRKMELDLRVGPITRRGFTVLIGGSAGNCIGQDFMEGWRFSVDRQRNLMRFFH